MNPVGAVEACPEKYENQFPGQVSPPGKQPPTHTAIGDLETFEIHVPPDGSQTRELAWKRRFSLRSLRFCHSRRCQASLTSSGSATVASPKTICS